MKKKGTRIKIIGYDKALLDKAAERIMSKIKELNDTLKPTGRSIKSGGFFFLPTKRTSVTFPISPHKHKKAQEAFVREIHKRAIRIFDFEKEDLEKLKEVDGIPQNVTFELEEEK